MEVYVQGKKTVLSPKNLLGEGGEAKIFLHKDKAIKVYHPQFITENKGDKLKAFPKNTPTNLIGPENLVTDRKNRIIGFSMEALENVESFIMLSNKKFRANFSANKVVKIFLDTLQTLKEIHAAAMVVGDFNDLNLLFREEEALYIDADSMQFGRFVCEVATEQFLDPRLYGTDFSKKPAFTAESDYYSFLVMLFKSLLLVNPYGGVHKKYPNLLRRAENRVSVFNSEVKYPKAAVPYKVLPDDLLDYFQKVFEKDLREKFPKNLLENVRWTRCSTCGETHARSICPYCMQRAPAAVRQIAMINRKCIATVVFSTRGRIITAKAERGKVKLVHEENGVVKREDGEKVLTQNPDNFTRFAIMGDETLLGKKNKVVAVEKGKIVRQTTTGVLGNLSVFETTDSDYFHTQGDMLMKGEDKIIGRILENQTWFKVGPKFGFGFYRVGQKTVYFTFDTQNIGINDNVDLPRIEGQLIDAQCFFSESRALFLTSIMESGKTYNSMYLVSAQGKLIASAKEEAENSRILSRISNKALSGERIVTATDEGLVLLETDGGMIKEVKLFTDTEPFVDDSMQVFVAPEGLFVVSQKDVKLLKLV